MASFYKKLISSSLSLGLVVASAAFIFPKPASAETRNHVYINHIKNPKQEQTANYIVLNNAHVREKHQPSSVEIIVGNYNGRLQTSAFKDYAHKLNLVDKLDGIFNHPISKLIDNSYNNKELTKIGVIDNKDETYTVNFYLANNVPTKSFKINEPAYLQFRGMLGLISDNYETSHQPRHSHEPIIIKRNNNRHNTNRKTNQRNNNIDRRMGTLEKEISELREENRDLRRGLREERRVLRREGRRVPRREIYTEVHRIYERPTFVETWYPPVIGFGLGYYFGHGWHHGGHHWGHH